MHIATESLRDVAKRFMRDNKLNTKELSILIDDIEYATLLNFIKGRTQPQEKTLVIIEDYLKNEGVLLRNGLPTQPVEPPTETEQTIINQIMGTVAPPKEKTKEDINPVLTEVEKAVVIHGIMAYEHIDESQKAHMLRCLNWL